MKTKLLLSLLLSFTAVVVVAQTDSTRSSSRVWDLRDCIKHALNSNLTLQRSERTARSSQVDANQSKWAMVPSLNASLNQQYLWGRNVDPVTYEYTTQELRFLNPSLEASVTLFNGFRIQNTIRQNVSSYHASEADLEKAKNDVMVNITSLYINVIFNKEQLENAKYVLQSSQSQLDRVRRQVAVGAVARSEELNLDAQVATNEVTLIQRENALNLSILQLKQALQIPANEPLDVVAMDVAVEDLVLDNNRDQVYDIARQNMPEIKAANFRVESSYYAVKAARGNLVPRLSMFAGLGSNYSSASDTRRFIASGEDPVMREQQIGYLQGTNTPVMTLVPEVPGRYVDSWSLRDQLQDNIQRSLGFSLSIPILNNFQSRSNVQRSIIQRDIAEISAKEVDNTLRQNVENAYNDAVAAAKTYNAAMRQVAAREEAFRMVSQRRDAGAATVFEYQISENDLYQAKSDLTRAKYDFIFRKKLLDFYQGKPLDY